PSGPSDAFVAELGPTITGLTLSCPTGNSCSPAAASASPNPAGVGNKVTFTFPIYNTGDPVTGGLFTASVPSGTNATISSATFAAGSGSGAGTCTTTSTTATCSLGVLNTSSA